MPTDILTGAHDWRLWARGWQVYTACLGTHTHKPRSQQRVPRHTQKHRSVPQGDLAKGSQVKSKKGSREGKAGQRVPRRRADSPGKWLPILAVGLGGRAGGCLRRESCFTGVSSWSPGEAAGFLGGRNRTGLAEGSWDRRAPDSLAEGLSSDTEGTTTWHTRTLHTRSAGGAGGSRGGTAQASDTAERTVRTPRAHQHRVTDHGDKQQMGRQRGARTRSPSEPPWGVFALCSRVWGQPRGWHWASNPHILGRLLLQVPGRPSCVLVFRGRSAVSGALAPIGSYTPGQGEGCSKLTSFLFSLLLSPTLARSMVFSFGFCPFLIAPGLPLPLPLGVGGQDPDQLQLRAVMGGSRGPPIRLVT